VAATIFLFLFLLIFLYPHVPLPLNLPLSPRATIFVWMQERGEDGQRWWSESIEED
jgi:hypothetical protein